MDLIFYIVNVFILIILVILLLWMYSKIKTLTQKNKQLTNANKIHKAQMLTEDIIRYRLDPHLLKNAFNAIQSHAYQSYYSLEKLSNVLDFMLYESDQKWVRLKDEISFAQNLIEINKLKISPLFDLHLRLRIPAHAENLLVPPFISINPIENAFKHADYHHDDSFISIVYEVKEDKLVLLVSNKVANYATNKSHLGGLGNNTYKNLLENIYQGEYLLIKEHKDGTYQVRLELKLLQDDQVYSY